MHRNDIATASSLMMYASSVVIVPVSLLQLSDELSFSLAEGGALETGRILLLIVTLFISGTIASRLGKSRTIAIGLMLMSVSLIIAGFAETYWTLLLLLLVIGFGSGFAEALINPLINDTHPENPGKYLNIINAFFSFGVVSAVLVSGFLIAAGISWRYLFIGFGILMLVPALILLPQKGLEHESGQFVSFRHWMECLRHRNFWIMVVTIFMGAACEGAFTFWSASYIQLHFSANASAGGIGTALFAGGMFAGRIVTGHLSRGYEQDRKLMLLFAVFGIFIAAAAYFITTLLLFYLVLFMAGCIVAPFWPSIQGISPYYTRGDATLLFILLSCAGIPGFGLVSFIMGIIADNSSLHTALLVIPVAFLLLALSLALLRPMSTGQRQEKRIE